MLSINRLKARVQDLEAKYSALQPIKVVVQPSLSSPQQQEFDVWEEMAITCQDTTTLPIEEENNETLKLARLLAAARFEDALYSTDSGCLLFSSASNQAVFESRLELFLLQGVEHGLRALFLGAALLQLVVQANWTGPPPPCFTDAEKYPLPCFPRESDLLDSEHQSALNRFAYYSKSSSAALGKDMVTTTEFPKTNAQSCRELEINGEEVCDFVIGLHFLEMSNRVFRAVHAKYSSTLLTCAWWNARLCTVWQECLQTRVVASSLKARWEQNCVVAESHLVQRRLSLKPSSLALFHMEQGASATKFQDVLDAKRCFLRAQEELELNIALDGALGKRTKFQEDAKAQLILRAKSRRPPGKNDPPSAVLPSQTIEPLQEGECAGFGTLLEAGQVRVQLTELDADTPLHERIQFEKEENEAQILLPIEQVLILNLCMDVKNSVAMEILTAEEMMAYVDLVMLTPLNFSIHACALLIKSKLEFEKYKTKERSVLQMQLLVDQQQTRLTPLQISLSKENLSNAKERMEFLHALSWPPNWRLKRGLADRYRDVGVLMSALHIYQSLFMWEDAVDCLLRMDKRNRAEMLIREQPEMTPSLLVTLGELVQDESLIVQAWEISHHRYARAKRVLGARAFARQDFAQAKLHYQEALKLNSHFSSVWFRLGMMELKQQQFAEAKHCFAELVRLEPEDSEAWANLSASLYGLQEFDQSLKACQEAVKHARSNVKLWQNQLSLSMKVGDMSVMLETVDRLIDVMPHPAVVDVQALWQLVEHGLKRPQFRSGLNRLIEKIKAKCSSQADVWVVLAEYYLELGELQLRQDCLLRRCRCFLSTPEWERNEAVSNKLLLTACVLCEDAVKNNNSKEEKEVVFRFVRGFCSKFPPSLTTSDKYAKLMELLQG